MKEIIEFKLFIENNKNELPLLIHSIEAKKLNKKVSRKSINIKKLGTSLYSIDRYYKHITRFL